MHSPRSLATSLLATLLLAGTAGVASAQGAAPALPTYAVMGGFGNVFGGLGVMGEYAIADGLLGVGLGLGYVPPEGLIDGGFAPAASARLYSGRGRHSLFGQTGWLPLAHRIDNTGQDLLYGPAFTVGYRYLAVRGFTATFDIGAGWAADHRWLASILGFGYRWR